MESTNIDSEIVSQINFSENGSNNFYTCEFYLTDEQYNDFKKKNEKGNNVPAYQTHEDHKNSKNDEDKGHAVILIDQDNLSSTFLNTW